LSLLAGLLVALAVSLSLDRLDRASFIETETGIDSEPSVTPTQS